MLSEVHNPVAQSLVGGTVVHRGAVCGRRKPIRVGGLQNVARKSELKGLAWNRLNGGRRGGAKIARSVTGTYTVKPQNRYIAITLLTMRIVVC